MVAAALGGLCALDLGWRGAPSAFAARQIGSALRGDAGRHSVGKGAWNIDISDDQFSAAAAGGTSGC